MSAPDFKMNTLVAEAIAAAAKAHRLLADRLETAARNLANQAADIEDGTATGTVADHHYDSLVEDLERALADLASCSTSIAGLGAHLDRTSAVF